MEIKLRNYQITARDFLIKTPKAGLFLDVGFGKTLTTLSALKELSAQKQLHGHVLVIAPKAIARSTWIDEMAKWGIKANIVSLIVNEKGKQLSRAKRLELYGAIETHKPAFYFINREMICDLVKWHDQNKKDWPFPTIIIDELQSFKSYKAERFKAIKSVMPYTKRFIGLTGTPIPNGLMDLWAEIYMMDGGKRLGKNITRYRNTFFDPGLVIDNNVVRWNIKPGAEEEIYKRISDLVISIKNPDIKLPALTYNNIYCHMSDEEKKQYKTLMKEKVLDVKDSKGNSSTITAVNAAVLSAKLRQMASGTLYINENKEYVVIHKHKLETLEYIINNTSSPVLVAYYFKSDKDQIIDYLTKAKINAQKFDGSPEMIHEWNKGNIPVMLLQPKSCGHGINIQDGGHTLVWYTIPDDLESYIQVIGRLYRQGQKYPVVVHHLLTEGTVDPRILKNTQNKNISEQALIDAVSAAINEA